MSGRRSGRVRQGFADGAAGTGHALLPWPRGAAGGYSRRAAAGSHAGARIPGPRDPCCARSGWPEPRRGRGGDAAYAHAGSVPGQRTTKASPLAASRVRRTRAGPTPRDPEARWRGRVGCGPRSQGTRGDRWAGRLGCIAKVKAHAEVVADVGAGAMTGVFVKEDHVAGLRCSRRKAWPQGLHGLPSGLIAGVRLGSPVSGLRRVHGPRRQL